MKKEPNLEDLKEAVVRARERLRETCKYTQHDPEGPARRLDQQNYLDAMERLEAGRQALLKERLAEKGDPTKPCICVAGDPCDYHAATCITCYPKCQGHPS